MATGISLWQRFEGSSQGRIQPQGWTPPEGAYAFVLGADLPGQTGRLQVGDYIQIGQAADYGDQVVQVRGHLRPPARVPDGVWWEASILIGGDPVVVRRIDPGQDRELLDLAWEVTPGPGAIGFQLTLQGNDPAFLAEVELPGFYVDAVVFAPQDASTVRLHNRSPAPGEQQAPFDAPVVIDVFPVTADLSQLNITIAGEPAYVAGVFQARWDGDRSGVATVFGAAQRITIDPARIWADGELVVVTVTSSEVGASGSSWTFAAERSAGPRVVRALALDLRTVRVRLDEEPAAEALLASRWAIDRTPGQVAVAVQVIAVAPVDAITFDLTCDIPLSPGRDYQLRLRALHDLFGNASNEAATFVAFTPPQPAGRSFDLYSMVAQKNRDEDTSGDLKRFLEVFQDCLTLLLDRVDRFSDISDPDLAPITDVNQMLVDLGNPFGFAMTDAQRRQLVQLLVPIYKQKGTDRGIVNVVRLFLGLDVTIEGAGAGVSLDELTDELGEDGGDPGTFVLGSSTGGDALSFDILSPMLTDQQLTQLLGIARYMKRAESRLVAVIQATQPVVTDPVELGFSGELGLDGGEAGSFTLHG